MTRRRERPTRNVEIVEIVAVFLWILGEGWGLYDYVLEKPATSETPMAP